MHVPDQVFLIGHGATSKLKWLGRLLRRLVRTCQRIDTAPPYALFDRCLFFLRTVPVNANSNFLPALVII